MIEKTVLDYLNAELSVPVYMQRPENPPAEYVLCEKTGSQLTNRIRRATMAFQSYAGTLYEASALNEEVKATVEAMPDELDAIGAAKLNTDYNFTDGTNKQYRYQAVYVITYV